MNAVDSTELSIHVRRNANKQDESDTQSALHNRARVLIDFMTVLARNHQLKIDQTPANYHHPSETKRKNETAQQS